MDKMTQLVDMIEEFLSEKRISEGGYAEVKSNDIPQLRDIIDELITIKWERDPDGDLPVSFNVVDKTRYYMPPFDCYKHHPIHSDDEWSMDDKNKMLRILNMNLQIAADELDTFVRITTDL
jgi:hypothetical protein